MRDADMNKNQELIDKYLKGQLSGPDLKAFEAKQQEADFNSQLNLDQKIVKAVKDKGFMDMMGMLEEEERKIQVEKKKQPRPAKEAINRSLSPRNALAIAASVLLLFTAGTLWWTSAEYSNTAIAHTFYQEAGSPGTLGYSKNQEELFNDGLHAFNTEDYEEAIRQLKAIRKEERKYMEAQYFLAHSFFNLKKYPEAIEKFQVVLKQNNLPFYIEKPEVEWNLLLNYVGNGQVDDATFQSGLEKILRSPDHPKFQEAQLLDKQLQSFWRKFLL